MLVFKSGNLRAKNFNKTKKLPPHATYYRRLRPGQFECPDDANDRAFARYLVNGHLPHAGNFLSLSLLSFKRENKNFLRRNYFLCAYIIILLLTVPIFEAERFVVVNSSTIFFSQPQDTLHKILGIWGVVSGLTTAVIVLLTDGVLVCLHTIHLRSFQTSPLSRYGDVLWFKKPLGLSTRTNGETYFGSFLFACGSQR